MRVLLDLNVVLDVVQNRVPHYRDSAAVLSLARLGKFETLLPSHAITTLSYILTKAAGKPKANETIDWVLSHFEIAVADKAVFRRARQLIMSDFEDAVVASLAEAGHCDHVVTRNVPDFKGSPVAALTPTQFLATALLTNPNPSPEN
jgi:predicted nucleic acid-binding protein